MPIVQPPLPGPIDIDIPAGTAGADFRYAVYAKQYWTDPTWTLIPHLIPLSATESDINGESVATFVYDFGRVSQAGQTVAGAYEPIVFKRNSNEIIPLRDVFIAIKVIPLDGTGDYCVWCGYLPSEQIELFGNRVTTNSTANPPLNNYPLPQGGQLLTAYGLQHVLAHRRPRGAFVWAGTRDTAGAPTEDVTTTYRNTMAQPTFNERGPSGIHFQGNRSIKRMRNTLGPSTESTFGFSDDGLTWSWLEMIEYVLYWSNDYIAGSDALTFPRFFLDGSAEPAADPPIPGDIKDPLFTFINSQRSDEITQEGDALAILRKIIDPRRGVGGILRWSELDSDNLPKFDAAIMLTLYSMSDKSVPVGSSILPANPNVFEDEIDKSLAILAANIEVDTSNVYDEIVIQGEPLIVCFSAAMGFEVMNNSHALLRKAWTAQEEAAYASAGTEAARQLDTFEKVYTTFHLGSSADPALPFDWKTGDEVKTLLPVFDETASLKTVTDSGGMTQPSQEVGGYLNLGKSILRELPLPAPFDVLQEVDDESFLRTFAIVARLDDQGAPTGKWDLAHKPPFPGESDPLQTGPDISATITPSDRNLEVKVRFPYNHALAKNHFVDVTSSSQPPRYDYEYMTITLAIQTDMRPAVVVRPTTDHPLARQRRIVINLADCETWWIAPGTVSGISATTEAPTFYTGPALVRDDTQRLRDVAAMASNIYGRPIIRVNLTRHGLYDIYAVGSLLKAKTQATVAYLHRAPNDTSDAKELLSVISQRTFDFREKTVSIATGPLHFGEID